jgi:hypothetical protein
MYVPKISVLFNYTVSIFIIPYEFNFERNVTDLLTFCVSVLLGILQL